MKYFDRIFFEAGRAVGSTRCALLMIALLCVLVYSRTLSVPFYFDDFSYILENPFIQSPGDIFDRGLIAGTEVYVDIKNSVLSRPLSYLTFSFNILLNGATVAGYHLVNLSIHTLNACLAYALVLVTAGPGGGISGTSGRNGRQIAQERLLAFFVAALFAAHPVMTNAVTYVVQRMASLATLFYLATVVMYAWSQRGPGRISLRWYLAALVSAAAAVKSKEIAATLPVMLALYDFAFLTGNKRQRFLRLAPVFAVVATCIVLTPAAMDATSRQQVAGNPSTLYVLNTLQTSPLSYLTTRFVPNPASSSLASVSPLEYLYTQLRVVVTYQRLLLLPVGLNFVHDYPLYRSMTELPVLLSLLWHVGILCGGLLLVRAARGASGMAALLLRCSAFGICWFYIALLMECSIIPMDDLILEHRMYLPAFGFLLSSVSLAMLAADRFGLQRGVSVAGIVSVAIMAVLTLHRNEQWRDPLVFWQDALAKSPGKHRIHGYIGNVYRDRGDMPGALKEYRQMLAHDFRYEQDHLELGGLMMENGMYREAVEVFFAARRHWPENLLFHEQLSKAYRALGDTGLAADAVKKAEAIPFRNGSGVTRGVGEKQ